jgi:hypothetical protein
MDISWHLSPYSTESMKGAQEKLKVNIFDLLESVDLVRSRTWCNFRMTQVRNVSQV